jgi:hypothetical protein
MISDRFILHLIFFILIRLKKKLNSEAHSNNCTHTERFKIYSMVLDGSRMFFFFLEKFTGLQTKSDLLVKFIQREIG